MTGREKFALVAFTVVLAINVAVAIWLGIETGEHNPIFYMGFAIPIAWFLWEIRGILRNWRTRVRAKEAGLKGKLRVLNANEVFGGAVTINQQPFLKLDLELEVPGRTTERFSKRMVVPRLAIPAVMSGQEFDVAVDPKHPRRFDVAW